MALEYGINFNTEAGRKKAEDEIKAWRKDMQNYFDKHKLEIGIGGKEGSTKTATTQLQGYRKELQALRNEYRKLSTAELANGGGASIIDRYRKLREQVGIYGGTLDQAVKSEDKMRAAAEKTTPVVNRQTQAYKRQSEAMNQLKSYAMNFLSVYAGIRMIKNLATITGEFEMQKISMQAILQDAEKGAAIFERIKELAVISPFQFKDLVSYTKQLSAFSIPYEDLYDTTKMLADLSAGLGVGMDRLILAYGQVRSAAVLRGQELRQFTEAGIPIVEELRQKLSEANGELVTTGEVFEYISARKVPFEMVRDIMVEMTSEGGKFYKMQEVQAETLKGKISNLTDAFQIMMANIGESDGGLMKGFVDATRALIENYDKIGKILLLLAANYGIYKAAMVAVSVSQLGFNNAMFMTGVVLSKIRTAFVALNATMMANPYIFLAAAVISLGSAFLILKDRTTAAEKAQKRFNDALAETQELADLERAKITELVNAVKDETRTRRDRQLKIEELQRLYPDIFSNLDLETAKNFELAKAIGEVNKELDAKSDAQMQERVVEITKELTRLRWEDGTTAYAGMYRYTIDHAERINELESERALITGKISENEAAAAAAANQTLGEWQKIIDSFVEANDASFLKYSGEDGTAFSYIGRIRDEYKRLTDEYSTYSTLVDSGSKKQAQRLKEQIDLTEQLAKTMGFSLGADGKTSSGGKDPNIEQNAMIKAAERLSELRAKMALEEKRYALEVRQVDIDMMADGTAKELAQIELTRDRELQAIEERRQAVINANRDIARAKWESEGKKGVFSEEVALTESQNAELISMDAVANMQMERSKERMLENLLKQYRDYAQKVEDIEKEKNEKIKDLNDGRTSDNSELVDRAIAEVEKKAKEEAASLAFDELKNADAWRILFSDLEDYTVKTLKESLAVVENADTSGLNAADAKAVQQAIERMRDMVDEKNPFFALTDGWEKFIDATKNEQPDEALDAINRMINGAEELLGYYEEFKGLMGAAAGEESDASFWTNTAGDIMSANVSTGGGVAKILMGDMEGIKDVIKGVTGYINVFRNIRNRKYDKEIERQEKVVESLEKEYKRLGKAMEESLGSDYYKSASKQAENLKNQAAAISKQIEAEKKKGKDADEDKIEELKQRREDLLDESSTAVADAIEKLTGTDITSAANDFAQAWIDAYVSFGDTTEAMQKRFKDMMQDMIVNAMIAPIMMKWLEPIFKMIDNAWKNDNKLTEQEIADIWNLGSKNIGLADAEANQTMGWLEKLGVNLRDSEEENNLKGISKGISTITEDTALVLGGYLNSIRMRLFEYIDFMMLPENRPVMSLLIQSQATMINHLQAIELNTSAIANSSNGILRRLEDVVISSDTGKGWALNVNA